MLRCLLTTSDFYSILILRTHWILGSHSLNNSESTIIHGNISILISQSVLTWFLRRIDFSNPFFRPGFCRFEQDCISRNIFNCPSFELLKSNLRKGYLGLGGVCVLSEGFFFGSTLAEIGQLVPKKVIDNRFQPENLPCAFTSGELIMNICLPVSQFIQLSVSGNWLGKAIKCGQLKIIDKAIYFHLEIIYFLELLTFLRSIQCFIIWSKNTMLSDWLRKHVSSRWI